MTYRKTVFEILGMFDGLRWKNESRFSIFL
jgi:hypothetical protein